MFRLYNDAQTFLLTPITWTFLMSSWKTVTFQKLVLIVWINQVEIILLKPMISNYEYFLSILLGYKTTSLILSMFECIFKKWNRKYNLPLGYMLTDVFILNVRP